MMNCLLNGLVPIWGSIWSIVTAPLFLASGVFFLYEDMPGFAQDILWWNPIMHAVGLMRRGFYPTYEASYVSLFYGYANIAIWRTTSSAEKATTSSGEFQTT